MHLEYCTLKSIEKIYSPGVYACGMVMSTYYVHAYDAHRTEFSLLAVTVEDGRGVISTERRKRKIGA